MSASPRFVTDRAGTPALVDLSASTDALLALRLASGGLLRLDAGLIAVQPDGSATTDLVFDDLDPGPTQTLAEVEEQLSVERRVRETGRVRVHLRTETVHEDVDVGGWRETVTVERVPVGRVVERPEAPREEGETTIVPVYEEQVVVERRLVLAHELHLTRRREAIRDLVRVPLRRQTAEIERLSADDPAPSA